MLRSAATCRLQHGQRKRLAALTRALRCRYSDVSTQQAMKDSLQQRHLCCTAPDTLACYPFVNADPFILHTCPHVYFVGNQQRYTVGRVEGKDGQAVVTIGVPAFAVTGAVVLVDLATLECQQMTFDVSL